MITPFSQSKVTYKISFYTKYIYLDLFEELPIQNILSISTYEIESKTIDAAADDIWCFEIYLSVKPEFSLIKKQILDFAENQNIDIYKDIIIEKVEDRDWVSFYQSQLKPLEIGKFFISSNIHQNLCPVGKTGIFIEASRAFGTGSHETTSGCVEALEFLSNYQFNEIIDVGTGSGILAFVAEKLWPKARIVGCDVDAVAIEIAKDNVNFNNSKVDFYQNNIGEILLESNQNAKFDLIISNILVNPLIELAGQMQQMSNHRAYIILAGFLDYQQQPLISAYNKLGFEVKHSINKNSWIILIMQYIK